MNLQHVNVKIRVDGEMIVDWEDFIDVFHRWVAEQSMDEMLIDVADYRHVPNGPGVVLVGHEADYAMDNTGGRAGLHYNCKVARGSSNEDRVRHALASAAGACLLLEAEFEGLKFSRREFELTINDRALAPNNRQTLEACSAELPELLQKVLGASEIDLDYNRDPRCLFGVVVRLGSPFDLERIAAA